MVSSSLKLIKFLTSIKYFCGEKTSGKSRNLFVYVNVYLTSKISPISNTEPLWKARKVNKNLQTPLRGIRMKTSVAYNCSQPFVSNVIWIRKMVSKIFSPTILFSLSKSNSDKRELIKNLFVLRVQLPFKMIHRLADVICYFLHTAILALDSYNF